MKSIMIILALCVLGACANSFEKVRNAASEAPEWYDAARTEIIGEGYPNLGSTPQLEKVEVKGARKTLRLSREQLVKARQLFATHPRSTEPITTEVEMRALKQDLRAKLNASGPAPTGSPSDMFLSEADLERFREIFRRAEARQ